MSDRACAIVCGAVLEEHLERLIRGRLAKDAVEPLFSGRYGPLASFAAKIDIAFALGLISKSVSADLHQVRKIRNAFAHTFTPLSFDVSPILDHVGQMKFRSSVALRKVTKPRTDFEISFAILLGFLLGSLDRVRPLKAARDFYEHFSRHGRATSAADVKPSAEASATGK